MAKSSDEATLAFTKKELLALFHSISKLQPELLKKLLKLERGDERGVYDTLSTIWDRIYLTLKARGWAPMVVDGPPAIDGTDKVLIPRTNT